jgi:hypothetical protein
MGLDTIGIVIYRYEHGMTAVWIQTSWSSVKTMEWPVLALKG